MIRELVEELINTGYDIRNIDVVVFEDEEGIVSKYEDVAEKAFKVCKTFSKVSGSEFNSKWENAAEGTKQAFVEATRICLTQDTFEPDTLHNVWLDIMVDKGFSYGKENDEEKKTSAYMVKYRNLPLQARALGKIFVETVKGLQ